MKINTAIYIHKPTGKVLWRVNEKPTNRYFWEKKKIKVFEWLIRERWLDRSEVEVKDMSGDTQIPVGEL